MSIVAPGRELTLVDDGDYGEPRERTPDDSKLVLEAMRHLAADQFERAERVRLSARQMFVYVSGLFTVAQVVAFTGFGVSDVSPVEQRWLIITGIAAAVSLATTGVLAIATDHLRQVPDISPGDVIREAEAAEEAGELTSDYLARLYKRSVNERAAAIKERRSVMRATTAFAVLTVGFVLAEILFSLVVRLP